MIYHLKFRFWIQEYEEETKSHRNLPRFYYQTEANSGEYDIIKCRDGIPHEMCISVISSHFTV